MAKFVKLGAKAGGFSDPFSRFKIAGEEIKKLTSRERTSGRIKAAIRGGHLIVVPEKEYEEYLKSLEPNPDILGSKIKTLEIQIKSLKTQLKTAKGKLKGQREEEEEEKELTLEEKFNEMTRETLVQYYKDTYDVGEEETKVFEKLKHEEMVVELLELDAD